MRELIMKTIIFVILSYLIFIGKYTQEELYAGKIKERNSENIGVVVNMDINNIDLPMQNNGSTAEDGQAYYPNGQTSLSFLFSGGIATTAYVNSQLRASWMAPASLIEEWQAGRWGMDPTDSLATFYVVNASDGPGSPAYVNWADAVGLGADFQDLNGDGQYDPAIDRPDILGDRTIWTVISDNTPLAQRTPRLGTDPIGLEIHQQAWAFSQANELDDLIFFRYRLINATNDDKDSLIFTIWTDPDIGDFTDDLIGCDPEDNLGFCFNDGDDPTYGSNPPAFGIQLLQGPIVDAVGQTAYRYRGPYFGTDTLQDKMNLPMTSYMYYISSSAILGDPNVALVARYYQIGGLDKNGVPIDPTQWGVGGTSIANPNFIYSGDPVTASGWLDSAPNDKRFMVNMGPFQMAVGDTQDIIIAYVVGQGNNALASLSEMRINAEAARNFVGITTGIRDRKSPIIQNYRLYQNYPNPFNPTTKISWRIIGPTQGSDGQLAVRTPVRLTVFNLSGQIVATLVNELQPAGYYFIEFNGSGLASGIYFYKIKAGEYIEMKKMVLMK